VFLWRRTLDNSSSVTDVSGLLIKKGFRIRRFEKNNNIIFSSFVPHHLCQKERRRGGAGGAKGGGSGVGGAGEGGERVGGGCGSREGQPTHVWVTEGVEPLITDK